MNAPAAPDACDPDAYRLTVLASLDLLDTQPEPEFDALVALARDLLDCPISTVSLVDADRQWFKARTGIDACGGDRDTAFCSHAIGGDDVFVVEDASRDPRFASYPNVIGPPHIRAYAGMPLRIAPADGGPAAHIGTICVIDTVPRTFDERARAQLRRLGALAEAMIEARRHLADALRFAEAHRADAQRIARQRDQLSRAERIAEMGSWRLDLSSEAIDWSDQVFAIHGLPIGPIPPLGEALDFYPVRARGEVTAAITMTIETGRPFDLELDFLPRDGPPKRVRSMGELEVGPAGPVALIGVFQDVTERYRMEQALRRSANHDALTGIANRAGFNAELARRIDACRAGDGDGALALMIVDLDGFKGINDAGGHAAGDTVLQTIARRLEAPYLAHCFPARLGGDEFALLVRRDEDLAEIDRIATRLLATLRRPVDLSSGTASVSGSIGLAWLEPGMAGSDLMHAADLALYAAKRAGKGVMRFGNARPGMRAAG